MTGLPDLVRDFAPVHPDSEPLLAQAAERYHSTHPTPRFFWSPTYLAAQPGVFTVGVIGGCLCVLKRRVIIGNHVMYLVLPPVSLHRERDRLAERHVIELLRTHHVSTMLSPLDRVQYGYREAEAQPDPRWPEFAYAAATHAVPVGSGHKNTRAAINLARRLDAHDEIHVVEADQVPVTSLERLADLWHAQTGRHRGERKLVRTFADHAARGTARRHVVQVLAPDGRPIAHSLSEEVSPGRVVIVSRLRDYRDTTLPDPTLLVHALECAHWYETAGPETLLTSGSAGTPGLTGHKAKLRPLDVMPLGRLDTGGRMTKEDYVASKPAPAAPPPTPSTRPGSVTAQMEMF